MRRDRSHAICQYCLLTFLVSVAGLMAVGPSSTTAFAGQVDGGPSRTRVIISTDLATGLEGGWRKGVSDIDDGLAAAMALADPALDVRGVVTTFGNNDAAPEAIVANRLLHDLLGSGVPVYQGAAVRPSNPQVSWYDGAPIAEACLNDGVEYMASELSRGPLTIVAIGPLTDVACLLQNYPQQAAAIQRVVAIGGRTPHQRFQIGKVAGLTDFNVMDPRAVQVLLEESPVPVTFMTFSLTSGGFVPRSALDPFRQNPAPLDQFIVGATVSD
jgi:pyrimidine-specific ribonucleoside hydrolase